MRAGIGQGVVAAGLALGACTSFGDASSGTPAPDSGLPAVAIEAGTAEAGTADGGKVTAPIPTCAPGVFCDAFERTTSTLLGGWDNLTTQPGTAEIDPSQAHTGSSSFHVQLPVASKYGKELFLSRSLMGMTHVNASLWLRKGPGDRRSNALEMNFGSSSTLILIAYDTIFVGRQKGPDGSTFQAETPSAPTLEPNVWTHVEIAITLAAAGPTYTFAVDGRNLPLSNNALYEIGNAATMNLGVGIGFATGTVDTDIWYDDVSFEVTP